MAGISSFAAGCDRSTASQRTIPYKPDVPIANRLLPGDKEVLIQMELGSRADSGPGESFEQELQRLRRAEIIALVRVATVSGEIPDRATIVRTRVTGQIDSLVKGPKDKPLGPSIEFAFDGGTAQIGNVVVTTGKFPRFIEGEQYLVLLRAQPGTASWLAWGGIGFRVDAQGVLQRIKISDGGEQSFRTSLVGRNVSDVIEALER